MLNDNIQVLSTIIYLGLVFVSVIISVMGSMVIISFLARKKIDVKEESRLSNDLVHNIFGRRDTISYWKLPSPVGRPVSLIGVYGTH